MSLRKACGIASLNAQRLVRAASPFGRREKERRSRSVQGRVAIAMTEIASGNDGECQDTNIINKRFDTPRPKGTRILGSASPLRLGSLRYLTQRWFSPQALTSGMPYRSCIAEAVRPCGFPT